MFRRDRPTQVFDSAMAERAMSGLYALHSYLFVKEKKANEKKVQK